MDAAKKKLLKDAYKTQMAVGGIYCVTCAPTGRRLIKSTPNIEGIRKRFQFSQNIKGCPDPALYSEWHEYGAEAFSLQILEELKQKQDQTEQEFNDDIDTLLELWLEKDVETEKP